MIMASKSTDGVPDSWNALYCTKSFSEWGIRLCKWTLANGSQLEINYTEANRSCPNGSKLLDYQNIRSNTFTKICYSCNKYE